MFYKVTGPDHALLLIVLCWLLPSGMYANDLAKGRISSIVGDVVDDILRGDTLQKSVDSHTDLKTRYE